MPKISVIMLTYNREKLVTQMIACILRQAFCDFEFIIVDNGSTDRSGAIADEYAAKDARIHVIHRARGNIGSGRNAGLAVARGEYIAFVDDDDYCEPDYLQFLYNLAMDHAAQVAICGATWANYDDILVMTSEQAVETLLWRKRYNVAFPTKLIAHQLFAGNLFLETGKYDDIYLMPRILAEAGKVAYHGLSKYHFNRHGENNSAWTQNHQLLDAETLQEYLDEYASRTEWLCERFPANVEKWKYFNWSFMLSMVEKVARLELSGCYAISENLRHELRANRHSMLACGHLKEFEIEWLEKYV